MAGLVMRTYQISRNGTKTDVDFGRLGTIDTWWPSAIPPIRHWVLIDCRLWRPPGTHSGLPVFWVEHCHGQWPDSIRDGFLRHQQRLARSSKTQESVRLDDDPSPGST
jgi:hypothetical protein